MAAAPESSSNSVSLYVLPSEIRTIILRLCLPTHRTISATWNSRDRRLSFRKNDIPELLTVCREFRDKGLVFYKPLVKPSRTTDLQFYVHKASDSLRIKKDTSRVLRGVDDRLLDIDECVFRVALRSSLKLDSVHGSGYDCYWCRWPFKGDSVHSIYLVRYNMSEEEQGRTTALIRLEKKVSE